MGGSVLVRTCPMLLENKYRVAGVAVLDVVEGEPTNACTLISSLFNSWSVSRLRDRGFALHAQLIE